MSSSVAAGGGRSPATKGLTDTLGEQVTGIVAPVSICMALTVALVRVLNPTGDSGSSAVAIATVYYDEQASDSTGQKLAGSVVNALIFVAIIGAMTFVLFLLFKYKCYKVIYAYMGFAGFNIFFFLTGTLWLKVMQAWHLHIDAISFCFILYNFAVVGMLGLFFMPVPITMKQGYLIVTGIVVAYIFTLIPEWTTWVLLVAMALYDLCAVLTPGGPLKLLVEMAIERNQEIPALVYESRPTRPGAAPGQWNNRRRRAAGGEQPAQQQPVAESAHGESAAVEGMQMVELPLQAGGAAEARAGPLGEAREGEGSRPQNYLVPEEPDPSAPLMQSVPAGHVNSSPPRAAADSPRGHARSEPGGGDPETASAADSDELGIPDSIKLGLGDFIFYSVLVGRASMYDMFTVYACYLAIVAGLGITLLLLAVMQKALPALPFSIMLGVLFYFLSRLILEPVIVPMVTHYLFF
eukprot:jgi/Tetstr1/443490/TSEL_031497.t1